MKSHGFSKATLRHGATRSGPEADAEGPRSARPVEMLAIATDAKAIRIDAHEAVFGNDDFQSWMLWSELEALATDLRVHRQSFARLKLDDQGTGAVVAFQSTPYQKRAKRT